MKYRIVHIESKNDLGEITDDYYKIQKRIWFMWADCYTPCCEIPSCGAGFYGKFQIYNSKLRFESLESCEKHLNNYFINDTCIKYKGMFIEKRIFVTNRWLDFYVVTFCRDGLYDTYFYDEDLEKAKERIDADIITTKTTVIN